MKEIYGYMVLCRNAASGRMEANWDGEIHASRDEGSTALREAQGSGEDAELVALVPVVAAS